MVLVELKITKNINHIVITRYHRIKIHPSINQIVIGHLQAIYSQSSEKKFQISMKKITYSRLITINICILYISRELRGGEKRVLQAFPLVYDKNAYNYSKWNVT